jgi:diaminohydroxyphosphoribosylaminopyrimidine deaminase/5-amino-6-(5-phosphoribosylamino)uracil reductase
MPEFTASDSKYMARALQLAAKGRYTARPNPMVGCVIVRDGDIIGSGWHRRAGAAHAEINALANAGNAKGATVYVTLEPCAHHGRTPPCIDALIAAGVTKVVVAMQDPFAAVDGRGMARLVDAGIEVRHGLMAEAAERLNRGFVSRVRRGRPFVRVKIAASLDGAVAMLSGESQWITGREARADVQRIRAAAGAVLTGIGTVLADDPSLNVRDASIDNDGMQPLRVVVDSDLRMPLSAGMLCLPGTTLIYCVNDSDRADLEQAGAEIRCLVSPDERVPLTGVLADLGERGINELLVEAGPELTGSLLAKRLVDELVIYQAPHIMGSETVPMFRTAAWTALADRRDLVVTDVRRVGIDTRITATVHSN